MDFKVLAQLGVDALMRMAVEGKLGPRTLWMAFKGAKFARQALKHGDVALPDVVDRRTATCAGCPSLVWQDSKFPGVKTGWCGQPFVSASKTCGCLVTLSVKGEVRPGAKVSVASEMCPQKKWMPSGDIPKTLATVRGRKCGSCG